MQNVGKADPATDGPTPATGDPTPAAGGRTVRFVSVSPAPGSQLTAGTRMTVQFEYSWPDFERGWDRLALVRLAPGREPWTLRGVPVRQASGRVTFELMAVEMMANNDPPPELQMQMVRVDRTTRAPMVLKTSDKAAFSGDLHEYEGQKLHLLPPRVGRELIAIDPGREPYRVHLPPALNRAGMVVWGLFRVCADRDARVFNVSVLKSADLLVDDDWMNVLRTFPHRPYTVDGAGVPFCYPLRLEVRSVE